MAMSRVQGFFVGLLLSCSITTAGVLASLYFLKYQPQIIEFERIEPLAVSMPSLPANASAQSATGADGVAEAAAAALKMNQPNAGGEQAAAETGGQPGEKMARRREAKSARDGGGSGRAMSGANQPPDSGGDRQAEARARTNVKTRELGASKRTDFASKSGEQAQEKPAQRQTGPAYSRQKERGSRGPAVNSGRAKDPQGGPAFRGTDPGAAPADESYNPPAAGGDAATGGASAPPRPPRQSSGGNSDPSNFLNALMQGQGGE